MRRVSVVVLILLLLWVMWWSQTTRAATAANFLVNSTADSSDSTPGDGVCNAGGGACTLRAAIEEANALGGG